MISRFYGRYRFLNNFYHAVIEYEGLTFPSVEHAYQAAKTLDHSIRKEFTHGYMSAGDAKRRGNSIDLRGDWLNVRVEIMRHLIRKKFKHEGLKRLLINTGDEQLIEGNYWHDEFWGVDVTRRPWRGENWLGRILMEVREEFS